MAAAVRYYLAKRDYGLALPEVVKLEVEKHFKRDVANLKRDVTEKHKKLLSLMGKANALCLPSEAEIDQSAANIFASLKLPIRELPFTFESAKQSLMRTIDALPPNTEKDQQFKDGVIWADCVRLLRENHNVTLVTKDIGFFERRDRSKLASSLIRETENLPGKLEIFTDSQISSRL